MTRIEAGLPCPEGCDGCMGGEMPCTEDAPAEVKPMPKPTTLPDLPEPSVIFNWEVQGGPEAGGHGRQYVPSALPSPRSHYAHDYVQALITAAVKWKYSKRGSLHQCEMAGNAAITEAKMRGASGALKNLVSAIYSVSVWHARADDAEERRVTIQVYVDGLKFDINSGQSRR